MNGAPSDAAVTALGGILVALIGVLATYLTVRSSRRAGSEQASMEQGAVSMKSFMEMVSGYEGRFRALESDGQKMKQDLDGMHDWKRAAIRYILKLRDHGRRHSPGEPLPEPPPELLLDLEDSTA